MAKGEHGGVYVIMFCGCFLLTQHSGADTVALVPTSQHSDNGPGHTSFTIAPDW